MKQRILRRLRVFGAILMTVVGVSLVVAPSASATEPAAGVSASGCYVVAYQLKNFKGHAACLMGNHENLAYYKWPHSSDQLNNSISSIKVNKFCEVTLYRDANYGGSASKWKHIAPIPSGPREDPDLSNNKVGDNKTTSLKVRCWLDA
jgi:hypothetical protein